METKHDQTESDAKLPRVATAHVIKAKEAIHMSNVITLLQRKAWNILLHNAYGELPTKEVHQISVTALVERMEYHSKNDEHLKATLEGLARTAVKWDVLDAGGKTKSWGVLSLLAEATIEDGVLTYSYGPILRQGLYNPRMYARISLATQNEFSSKHALALYEICVHWRRQESGCGETPWIPLTRFRELLGIPADQYTDFRRLNQRVIKEPLEEINDVTDLSVKVDYKRHARKVVAVKFRIWSRIEVAQKGDVQGQLFAEPGKLPEIVVDLVKAGLPEQEAKEVWYQGWDYVSADKRDHRTDFVAYVREKIAILDAKPNGSVKNRVGFLIQAIRENYTDPQILAETHVQQRLNAAEHMRKLNERKDRIQQEWDEADRVISRKIVADSPTIVDELLKAALEHEPSMRMFVKRGKTPLDNYEANGAFTALINARIKEKYPERFKDVDARFRKRIAEAEEEIAASDPG